MMRVKKMVLKRIAIIPDGNRRFAQRNMLGIENAYAKGFQKVEEILKWAENTSIEEISFWALSLENYQKRSGLELKVLFSLMKRHLLEALKKESFREKKIRIRFIGKLELLPKELRELMKNLEEETKKGTKSLNIAVAYSGKEEILSAAKRFAIDFYGKNKNAGREITEKDFEKYLYLQNAPDLIIRTGNVSRLSGFLPWQNAYSELYFSKKMWPEFDEKDFRDAIDFYDDAGRRFGK